MPIGCSADKYAATRPGSWSAIVNAAAPIVSALSDQIRSKLISGFRERDAPVWRVFCRIHGEARAVAVRDPGDRRQLETRLWRCGR